MTGISGHEIFNYHYLNYFSNTGQDDFQERLQLLAERSLSFDFPTFCNGFTGINWYFKFLHNKNILAKEDIDILCYRDKQLEIVSLEYLDIGNYDFLHGSLGIAYYLLYTSDLSTSEYFAKILLALNSLIEHSGNKEMIPNFNFDNFSTTATEVNLGLSHGIPSVLKFCMECFKKNIEREQSKRLALKIVNYLIKHINKDSSVCFFPTMVYSDGRYDSISRLAWCYGDLGIGLILYQAGKIFEVNHLVDFSLEVLHHSAKRRELLESLSYDAGFCHGTSGVAYIFHKMWYYTKDPEFKNASMFWIQRTIELARYNDGIGGFKKFSSSTNTLENDSGLLEGASGTGLVLLSFLTNDFSWDYCLMLND